MWKMFIKQGIYRAWRTLMRAKGSEMAFMLSLYILHYLCDIFDYRK